MEEFLVGMWHYIVPPEGLPVKITGELCSLETFRSQLQRIKDRFSIISASEFTETIRENKQLPPKSLLLTFDDGTKDHYQVVLPVLQEMGLTATFSIVTAPLMGRIPSVFKLQLIFGGADPKKIRYEIFPQTLRNNNLERYLEDINVGDYRFEPQEIGEVKSTCNDELSPKDKDIVVDEMFRAVLGNKEAELVKKMFLDKSEVVTLHRAGMNIGSHGVNHHTMSTLEDEDLKKELSNSKRFLEELLGSEVSCLIYPGCFPPNDIEKVKEAGYLVAFQCDAEGKINRPPYNIFTLRRIHEKDLEKEFLA